MLLVCNHDYTNTTKQIFMKLVQRMNLCTEWTRATFGADPDKLMHRALFNIFVNFSEDNAWIVMRRNLSIDVAATYVLLCLSGFGWFKM